MKILLLLAFSVVVLGVFATEQADTVKTESEIKTLLTVESNGGYGALSMGYTTIGGNNAFSSGFKGGWIINHKFVLGGAGYGMFNCENCSGTGLMHGVGGGYGGLLLEPILMYKKPVHISVPIIIGGGGVGYFIEDEGVGAMAFVFAPGIEVELNMAEFFRLAIGVDYRFTTDLVYDSKFADLLLPSDALRAFSVHAVFKFGKF